MSSTVAHLEGPLANRDRWNAPSRCSIGRAMQVVGNRSTMLLMREAYYGTTRFDDFARRVGITEASAAARLKDLLGAGLLQLEPYREPGQRTRQQYVLTEMGRDLMPALLALMQWGDTYLADEEGPPLALEHSECGAPVAVSVRCAEGHEVPLEELTVRRARTERPH